MNDGDYPRAQQQMDFDIMSRPGQYRPGIAHAVRTTGT